MGNSPALSACCSAEEKDQSGNSRVEQVNLHDIPQDEDFAEPKDLPPREDKAISSPGDQIDAISIPPSSVAGSDSVHKSNSMQDSNAFSAKMARGLAMYPGSCVLFGILLVVLISVLGILAKPPEIDHNFDSFMKTDVRASLLRDAFLQAYGQRASGRRLQENPTTRMQYMGFEVKVVHEDISGGSVLNLAMLQRAAALERELRSLPEWGALCNISKHPSLCDPGITMSNFAMPTLKFDQGNVVPVSLRFDGEGKFPLPEPAPMEIALASVNRLNLDEWLFPTFHDQRNPQSISKLRSVFVWLIPVATTDESKDEVKRKADEYKDTWRNFARDSLLPLLQAQSTTGDIRVYYDGTDFKGLEVQQALWGDIGLAAGSVAFIFVYALLHTRSFLLSFVGILLIALAVPIAYVTYAFTTNTTSMNLVSFLSLFLVIGLGADVIFLYADFWKSSADFENEAGARLLWTYKQAGKASLTSMSMTAMSFFANLASVLKPLREFGVFMGLCVMFVWILMSTIFAPLCLVDERIGFCSARNFCGGGETQSLWTRALRSWTRWISYRRHCFAVIAILLAIGALIMVSVMAETDTRLPNVFPESHNRNQGQKTMDSFKAITENIYRTLPVDADVCKTHTFDASNSEKEGCALYWCETDSNVIKTPGKCDCFKQRRFDCAADDVEASVRQRFVGLRSLRTDDLQNVGDRIIAADGLSFPNGQAHAAHMRTSNLPSLLLQDWESGDAMVCNMTEVTSSIVRNSSAAPCGWNEVCFCDSFICDLQPKREWVQGDSFRLPERSTRRLQSGVQWQVQSDSFRLPERSTRRLQSGAQWQVIASQRARIDVVFGISASLQASVIGQSERSWSFNSTHEISQPWAQRNLLDFCRNLKADLLVTKKLCWMEGFYNYTKGFLGRKFPIPAVEFSSVAMRFGAEEIIGHKLSKEYWWVVDGSIKASYMSFDVDINKYSAVEPALDLQSRWDEYLSEFHSSATRFTGGAWHTSELWVRAEALGQLISSTLQTLAIAVSFAFVTMLVATKGDLVLSLISVFATCGVLCGLAFFIAVVLNLQIGPIEVVGLIAFIGYSATYSVHIAHMYSHCEAVAKESILLEHCSAEESRRHRTDFAVRSLGGAVIGSASTTIGCSIFLLFCMLTMFQRLGAILLAVTLMSALTAMVPLPAVLLICGPHHPGLIPFMARVRGWFKWVSADE